MAEELHCNHEHMCRFLKGMYAAQNDIPCKNIRCASDTRTNPTTSDKHWYNRGVRDGREAERQHLLNHIESITDSCPHCDLLDHCPLELIIGAHK